MKRLRKSILIMGLVLSLVFIFTLTTVYTVLKSNEDIQQFINKQEKKL
jgi:cell division protein FtsL